VPRPVAPPAPPGRSAGHNLFDLWKRLPPGLKGGVRRQWYEWLSVLFRSPDFRFMNFGFAPPDDEAPIALAPEDEPDRYPIGLYHRTAAAVDWSGKDGLEVGCGRGGGASYVMRSLKPRSLVGMDLTAGAVRFCERHLARPGLSFRQGDAQDLPFPDASFDVVLNVESSLLYDDVDRFFREVMRVLRPAGAFVYADYRNAGRGIERLRRRLREAGFEIAEEEDLTPGVARAMVLDAGNRRRMIERHVPRLLQRSFSEFAGLKQGGDPEACPFATRRKAYVRFLARRPGAS